MSPLATFRASVEAMVQAGIDLLDAMDAPGTDREPESEQEVVSEDDAAVTPWPSWRVRGGSEDV